MWVRNIIASQPKKVTNKLFFGNKLTFFCNKLTFAFQFTWAVRGMG